MEYLNLIPVVDENKNKFIEDIQEAFQKAYEAEYDAYDEIILPTKDIEESFSKEGAESYFALIDSKIVGGAIIVIDKKTRINHLDLLYVKTGCQGNGIGVRIWQAIEKMHPETKVWETHTPYFDKRNIHFYVNKCGFRIVEFFNPKHKDPHWQGDSVGGLSKEVGQYFFRFEKQL